MSWSVWLGTALSVGLFGYLLYALFRAERF